MLRKLFGLLGAIIRHVFAVLAALAKGMTPPAFVHADEEPSGLNEEVLAQAEEDRRQRVVDRMAEAVRRWAATPLVSRPPVSEVRVSRRVQAWLGDLSENNIALLGMLEASQIRGHLFEARRCLNLPLLGEAPARKEMPPKRTPVYQTYVPTPANDLRADRWPMPEPEEEPALAPGR